MRLPLIAAAAVLAATAASAAPVVLDFETAPSGWFDDHEEDGFLVRTNGGGFRRAGGAPGDAAPNWAYSQTTIASTDPGLAFGALSIDLGGWRSTAPVSGTTTFVGDLADGGTVSQDFAIGSGGTFTFGEAFGAITALRFVQGSASNGTAYSFDDVTLELAPVPLPASLPLAAAALAGLAFLRRRRG